MIQRISLRSALCRCATMLRPSLNFLPRSNDLIAVHWLRRTWPILSIVRHFLLLSSPVLIENFLQSYSWCLVLFVRVRNIKFLCRWKKSSKLKRTLHSNFDVLQNNIFYWNEHEKQFQSFFFYDASKGSYSVLKFQYYFPISHWRNMITNIKIDN